MKRVKIVFIDLDSTLTKMPGKIDIKNKIIINRLTNMGIHVVINTGRSLPYTIPICKQFCTSNYVITSNGAEIYNYISKKEVYRSIISHENIEILDNLINKYNLFFTANGIEKRYTNKKEDNKGLFISESLKDIDDRIAQVVLESYNLDNMKQLRKEIEEQTNLKIANKTKHIEENKLLYYDITNNDVDKGTAVEILCKKLNIDLDRTMAIGDSDNDIPMLKKVEYKVAVSNASDNLKKEANLITLSNKQNGVATILNELYIQLNK